MMRQTSERHSEILNNYQSGQSRHYEWAHSALGDIELLRWDYGEVDFRWKIDGRFVMPDGVMFGGHIASVGDHVASFVTFTVLSENNQRFRTSRLDTNFFRPMSTDEVKIEARVTNVSTRLIHVEADFIDPNDKLLARICALEVRGQKGSS